MASVFTKIINRDISAHIVAENDDFIAFLDVNPLVEGHTLVVPKQEVDYIYDLTDKTLSALHLFAKNVAKKVEDAIPCKRIGVAIIGLEVPHVHIHLIPLQTMDDINFSRPKLHPSQEALEATAKKIAAKS